MNKIYFACAQTKGPLLVPVPYVPVRTYCRAPSNSMLDQRQQPKQMFSHLQTIENSTKKPSVNSNVPFHGYFSCIECLTPSASLYRQYSSPSSVKLTRCVVCKKDVDPYVEREWLLVFLDVILHRIPAHRHLYLHGIRKTLMLPSVLDTLANNRGSNFGCKSSGGLLPVRLQYTILVTFLGACLKYQASSDVLESRKTPLLVFLLLSSLAEHLTLVGTVLMFSTICLSWLTKSPRALSFSTKQQHRQSGLVDRLFMGTTMPVIYMKLFILFILIWENTLVVRGLGSLLILSQQCLSVLCIMEYEFGMRMFMKWIQDNEESAQRQEQENKREGKTTETVTNMTLWVKRFVNTVDSSNHTTRQCQRGFVINKNSVATVVFLVPVAVGYVLRSYIARLISHLCNVPFSCSGFHFALAGTEAYSICVT